MFQRDSDDENGWIQRGGTLGGENSFEGAGQIVALSASGTIVAFTSTYPDSNRGYAKVFQHDPSVTDSLSLGWKQLGSTIVGENQRDLFGYSMAISADGKTLAVGGPRANEDMGYVNVFGIDLDSESDWRYVSA